MGKTRLAAALCEQVVGEGRPVVELVASPLHTEHGLWPVKQLIEQRCGMTRHTEGEERLQRLRDVVRAAGLGDDTVPLLAALIGIGPEAGYEPVASDARRLRDQISEAAEAFVGEALAGGPALLVCDDAQWFDQETQDLVARVVRGPRSTSMVVLTARSPQSVPRGDGTTLIHLEALGDGDRLALMQAIGGDDVPPGVLDRVAARSDGIPLYIEELLRAELQAPDELASMGAPGSGLPQVASVPDVLYEPLVARLHVSENGAALAAAVATIGREADRDVLARVTDLDPDDLAEALTALLGALILERAGTEEPRYRFRHELVRAVAYDLQPPSRRRDLHGRVADALLSGSVDGVAVDWAVVGAHFETAGRALDAAEAFERASTLARARGALAEARTLLTRAIEIVAEAPEQLDEREANLRLRRGFLAVSLEGNSSAEAAADYERCLELSIGAVESDTMFSTLCALWSYYTSRGELDRAQELIDVLHASSSRRAGAKGFVTASGGALVATYRGNYAEALARCEESIAWGGLFENETAYASWWFVPLDPVLTAHTMLGMARLVTGDSDGAWTQMSAARRVAAALAFPQGAFSLAAHLSFEVVLRAEVGELDAASISLDELGEVSERHGFDQWSIVAMTQRTMLSGLQALRGDADDRATVLSGAAASIGGNLMMWKMVDTWVFVPYYTTMQGVFHAGAGETDLADAVFAESLAIAERTGMRFYDAETLRLRAALRTEPEAKAAGLVEAIELARSQTAALYEVRAAVDLADLTGDTEPIRSALGRFQPNASYPELGAARARLSGR
jgi:tetratricopeptide (TPR) repeat protein